MFVSVFHLSKAQLAASKAGWQAKSTFELVSHRRIGNLGAFFKSDKALPSWRDS